MSTEPSVHGVPWSRAHRYLGNADQAARVEQLEVSQGAARGTRLIRVATGGGLELDVHPDRALDLGQATIDGVGVAWLSPTGFAAPAFAERDGLGWLRTFGGGLLTTCGLDAFGPPGVDGFGTHGQHGRISGTPATVLEAGLVDGELRVVGTVRQAGVHGENLELHRTISAAVGSRTVTVRDRVRNDGPRSSPLMVLYHCNLGWPLVGPGAELEVDAQHREALQESDDVWDAFGEPEPTFAEQVYLHRGASMASLHRPAQGLGVEIRVDPDRLPVLYQWKMLGSGTYVTGLEPANCAGLTGRGSLAEAGRLPMLEPGQSQVFDLELRFHGPALTPRAARTSPG